MPEGMGVGATLGLPVALSAQCTVMGIQDIVHMVGLYSTLAEHD